VVQVLDTIAASRAAIAERRSRGTIGFVPTMGALHEGHASLIQRARSESGTVVVSIFVNPLQFDRPDDLTRYPRSLEADLEVCRRHGVDIVFAPAVSEMYPRPMEMSVKVGKLADHLCGRFRPGHFEGVASVVLKLFEIVQPDTAYFGEKDAQQLAVVRRLTTDFNVPVRIAPVPTVREPDGLALSSRNLRLSPGERQLAPCLFAALQRAAASIQQGAANAAGIALDAAKVIPADERLRLEYLEGGHYK
jgi:pantoate--beta-alanine ligase